MPMTYRKAATPDPHADYGRQSVIVLLGVGLFACAKGNGSLTERSPAAASDSIVTFQAQGRTLGVRVEVARTDEDRARGLMFREQLDARAGMLFVFDDEAIHPFWMKNTLIPLDMIFVSGKGQVVGVIENATPQTTTSRSIDMPSRYVIEVNAGFARAHGIHIGTRVGLPPLP